MAQEDVWRLVSPGQRCPAPASVATGIPAQASVATGISTRASVATGTCPPRRLRRWPPRRTRRPPVDTIDEQADTESERDTDTDTDTESEPATEAASRRGLPTAKLVAKSVAVIAAVLGIAALASTSAWIVVKHQQAERQRDLNADFAAAARQGVVTLMSLNFNTAEQDVQRIVDNSTGQFKEDFEARSEDFVRVAEESKVITDATVTATAVKSQTGDTADVLVSAYSTVTNEQGAKEEPRTWRLIVSMARDGDQLKVEKVEFAP